MLWAVIPLFAVVLLSIALLIVGGGSKKASKKEILDGLSQCESSVTSEMSSKRDCITRLDSLLGKSLRYNGAKGENVGGMLKNVGRLFDKKTYDRIWTAHKLRNRIVHDNYSPSGKEFREALKYFKIAIRRLLK